jgi:hypothetical protein
MTSVEKSIFGPLGPKFCLYFYYLSIFGFALMIITFISFLWIGISKKMDSHHYLQMFYVALVYFIFYFQNRLLYTMCVK